jgi:hypothetical protein
LCEIAFLVETQRAHEQREDWYTARIVAMIAGVNSKHGKYQPIKYMAGGRELMREQAERRAILTGDQVLERMRALGVPVIDKRKVS